MYPIYPIILSLFLALQPLWAELAQPRMHQLSVQEAELFSLALRQHSEAIKATQGKDKKMIAEAHRSLFRQHPIAYDWWLQDGESRDWYLAESLEEQLSQRLEKLGHEGEASFERYLELCVQRREARLARFLQKEQRVVYSKFRPLRPSFFAYTEALSDARAECNFIPGSELGVLHMKGIWGEEQCILSSPEGVLRDPDVHFDGEHILFAWKKSAKKDDYHLYEYHVPQGTLKQLTHGLGRADIEPIYLPDDNIMFNSTRAGHSVDCFTTEVSNLYLCDREGRFIRRIGFDQVHTPHPALLDDGRVLYTRWDYNDRGQVYTQPLFQMYPDGTGQQEYYGLNSFFPTTLTHVAGIPSSRKVMAIATGHHSPQHGKLCIIDPEAGRNEEKGVTMLAPKRAAKPERVDAYGQWGEQFQYPCPLSEQELLISYSPLGYDIGMPMHFFLYWMDASGQRELLMSDEDNSCNQPVLLSKRKRPFQRASHVDYENEMGTYYMQNIYAGHGLLGVKEGTIKKLRIVEIEYRAAGVGAAYGAGKGGEAHAFSPVGVGNASWDIKRVHGTVDVYEDGSAFFHAPARKPLYFQALDENNRVVQSMRSWSTLMPGEVQSCVGCHEHANSVPLSEARPSIAMQKGIASIQLEHGANRVFSYREEVQPIWDRHCISCHDGSKDTFSLKGDLRSVDSQTKRQFSDSYLKLTHARQTHRHNASWQGDDRHPEVNWISALSEPTRLKPYNAGSATSNLIKRLESGHGKTKLSREEIERVALWIDLGVPFIAHYREAHNWTKEEQAFYDYYEKKQKAAKKEELKSIQSYINHLKS